jgi:hypothetical protein
MGMENKLIPRANSKTGDFEIGSLENPGFCPGFSLEF